ncbi:nickel/cobalt ABC transporter permease [Yersinia massiliensis]|uniref:nickel/cobalt ABC transporter permease n=1 Tax=Yersinia massiliensis TaxID=419257 RepID=UPI0005B64DC2|nr:nickel/cobalt ABC transporter permease [Yersinia massiliensis]MCB5309767.1 ABC transporter permease subunit [Yersinia massiliensis]
MMRMLWQRLRADPMAFCCLTLLVLILFAGIFAPWLAPQDPTLTAIRHKYQPMSLNHLLGTDNLGRDVLSRLLYGIRTTVFLSLFAMLVTILFGTVVGLIAGYFRGRIDEWLMRLCDMMLSFPSEVMIFAIVGMLGPGINNIILAIVVIKWAWYARMIRGVVVQYSDKNYIRYAKVIACSDRHIMLKHLLPVTAAEIIVLATTDMGSVILTISALSFLGLGVQPPTPEWGVMLNEAKNVMFSHPTLMLPAGIAVVTVVAAFNFIGDFLRDALVPSSQSHSSSVDN